MRNLTPSFGSRLFLWFEGQRLSTGRPHDGDSDLSDFFFVETRSAQKHASSPHRRCGQIHAHMRQMFTSR